VGDTRIVDGVNRAVHITIEPPGGPKTSYPSLAKGELAPAFGTIYRVEGLAPLEFRRVPKADLPAGIAIKPDSYILPRLGRTSYSHAYSRPVPGRLNSRKATLIWHVSFEVRDMTVDEDPAQPPSADIDVWLRMDFHVGPRIREDYGKSDFQTVRAGDRLVIGDFVHDVRKIVPPDPKRHVTGWVELSPRKPLPVATPEEPAE
jgi:hypothetical protein